MSFQLLLHNNHNTGLVAVCDVCDTIIKDATTANILWDGVKAKPGEFCRYRIACKVKCTAEVDARYGRQYWEGLESSIGFLMNNCGVDYKRMLELPFDYAGHGSSPSCKAGDAVQWINGRDETDKVSGYLRVIRPMVYPQFFVLIQTPGGGFFEVVAYHHELCKLRTS